MFVVRQARASDLPDLFRLARLLDTVNLPADEAVLRQIIERSEASFARAPTDPDAGRYLFVLDDVENASVVGVSMAIAAHGSIEDPHHFFKLDVDERYSATLDALFRHQTLQFRRSLTPHTEIGALILDPAFRGHPEKLGRLLSFARFVYIGAHRDRFKASIQAELLPPFEPDGTSLLWEWLGRRFTGLDYQEADRLSNSNHEFARELFPQTPMYTSLMPAEVRAVIGSVGPATRGVAKMLRSIGFRFNNHIDPFDGGPHFECATNDVLLIRQLVRGHAVPADVPDHAPRTIVATLDRAGSGGFVATSAPAEARGDALHLDPHVAAALGLRERDAVVFTPFPPASAR